MIVTAWKSGSHGRVGTSYGVKLKPDDRDRHFAPSATSVEILIEDDSAPFRVTTNKKSFWNATCRKLISSRIRDWMSETGIAPWSANSPPKLQLEPVAAGLFRLSRE